MSNLEVFLYEKVSFCLSVASPPSQTYLNNVAVNGIYRESQSFRAFLNLVRPMNASPLVLPRRRAVNLSDFELLRLLGEGCMGRVLLARSREDRHLFAIKAIPKEVVFLQREVEHTRSERDILVAVGASNHPFLVTLHSSFQNDLYLFLVLDYCPGGDLATQLAQKRTLSADVARFYAAEVVLGLDELHRRGIIYRDLKPENILLGRDGHVILTDFGLSKQFSTSSQSTTKTFCGTAEYLAPEILQGFEYTYAVDWFSLGALLYEMMVGIVRVDH